mgnify:CR=1 FL=1
MTESSYPSRINGKDQNKKVFYLDMKEAEEIKDDFMQGLKERFSSPFYGYFIMSWLVWNWRIVYTTFFVGGELIFKRYSLLKVEYISTFTQHVFPLLFGPLLSVAFFVYLAPFVTHEVYKKVEKDKSKLKDFDEDLERERAEVRTSKIEARIKESEAEKKLFANDPQIVWLREFQNFKEQTYYFNRFNQILDSIYSYNGYIDWDNKFVIDKDLLAFAHSNELIEFQNGSHNIIELTEKGMFFVRKYSELKNNKTESDRLGDEYIDNQIDMKRGK